MKVEKPLYTKRRELEEFGEKDVCGLKWRNPKTEGGGRPRQRGGVGHKDSSGTSSKPSSSRKGLRGGQPRELSSKGKGNRHRKDRKANYHLEGGGISGQNLKL